MQKIISMLLLSCSIYLLYQPLQENITTQLEKFYTTDSSDMQDTSEFLSDNVSSDDSISGVIDDFSSGKVKTIQPSELGCTSSATTPASLYAKSYCVMDADSGRVLLGKEENTSMPMASTTKIMTCILALEYGHPDDIVTVSSYAASMPDVQLNIREGETYRLGDLLYSLMLESHNDTAVAIAEHLGGSVEGFAELMNTKAQELGLENTHFVTPNGLDDDEHYTTARELCLLGAYAIQNEDFLNIIQTKSYSFQELSGARSFCVNNHDAFLSMYPGAIGIKTGFTGNAGYCFCGAATQNGKTLVSAVLACGWPPNKSYKWADTKKLMDYGFSGFSNCQIPILDSASQVAVTNGVSSVVSLKRQNIEEYHICYSLTATDSITIQQEVPNHLDAPVRAGDIVGYENYYVNDSCIASIPLHTTKDIARLSLPYLFQKLCAVFMFH